METECHPFVFSSSMQRCFCQGLQATFYFPIFSYSCYLKIWCLKKIHNIQTKYIISVHVLTSSEVEMCRQYWVLSKLPMTLTPTVQPFHQHVQVSAAWEVTHDQAGLTRFPDFGRTWTPFALCISDPKVCGITFKWDMWKIGGIKIEHTALQYFLHALASLTFTMSVSQ